MSASSKKKIRKEQNAEQLTERQRKARKEAVSLKIYSIVFTIVIAAIVLVAVGVMAYEAIDNAGLANKYTTAITIGDHKLSTVEMNYYYRDAISMTYNQWESTYGENLTTMLSLMGIDLTQPLDEQDSGEDGKTWADYFMDMAIENAYSDYVLSDAAEKEKFTLPEDAALTLESQIGSLEMQSMINGYPSVNQYVIANYGKGASYDSYLEYVNRSALANAYYNNYRDTIEYTDQQIDAYAQEHPKEFSSFSYAVYKLSYTSYLTGGTVDAEGQVTYSDEEIEQAKDAVKAEAEKLAKSTTLENLDAAIGKLSINKDATSAVSSTKYENELCSGIEEAVRTWLTQEGRKSGDIGMVENASTSTAEDGTETTTVTGYIIICALGEDDNRTAMSNVRHLLVTPIAETDEVTGEEVTTDEAWDVAKQTAEMHLREWQNADGTEEGLIELIKESSDDSGTAENGGLIENIHRDSAYVEEFLNWSIDPARTPGETGIVKTSYGYHIMYYVGGSELTYRDYMITEQLRTQDLEAWFNGLKDAVELTRNDLSLIDTSTILFQSV